MAKFEMRDLRHLSIVFQPELQDARIVIIDQEQDVRICDGKTVVKVRFAKDGHFIQDVLQDDLFLVPVLVPAKPLSSLYNDVERLLSHALQPGNGHRELVDDVTTARDNLRTILRKMGWRGQF